MDRLTELQAEAAKIIERAKAMLQTFPAPDWGTEHNAEWNAHMHRMNQIDAEIKSLTGDTSSAALSPAGVSASLQVGGPVPRGIVSVQAEAPDISAVVAGVNAAFTEFKADHNARLAAVEQQLDASALQGAAQQMNGSAAVQAAAPALGPKALRTYADFRAHFEPKGVEAGAQVGVTDFLRGVAGMKTSDAVMAALSVGTNTAGGYSVPAQTMPQILSALVPASSLLQAGAGIVPMPDGAKTVTTAIVDTIPTAAWRLEAGQIAESNPAFRGVVAAPKSLAFMFKVSRELLADGQGIEAALTVAIGQSFALALDRAGLRGSGTGAEPLGINGTPGVTLLNYYALEAAPTAYTPILRAWGALLGANVQRPTAAIMAPRTLISLANLRDNSWQPLRKPEMIADLPLIATPQIPVNLTNGIPKSTGKESEIYVGDFSQMYFLMREAVSIQLLREAFSSTGEIGFLCHVRADVVINRPAAFAVVQGVPEDLASAVGATAP